MINLISCRERVIKIDEIEERIEITKILEGGIERILYKKGENKPFTGKIVKDFENDGVSFEINVKNGKKRWSFYRILLSKRNTNERKL